MLGPPTTRRAPLYWEAMEAAEAADALFSKFATRSTVPGTSVQPITAADVQVDKNTGVVTVTVIEDFSSVELENKTKGVSG